MSRTELLPYEDYVVSRQAVRYQTHKLLQLYRFLDHHCIEGHLEIDTKLWKMFVKWNGAKFWESKYKRKRNFVKPALEYIKNPALARQSLDLSTKEMRIQSSREKQSRKRRNSKGSISEETIRRVSLNAFNALGKEWKHYESNDQCKILEAFVRRVGKPGENFLVNSYKDKVIQNVRGFFQRVAQQHSAKNILGSQLVKAALSGENLEPRSTRRLVAPTSRLEG